MHETWDADSFLIRALAWAAIGPDKEVRVCAEVASCAEFHFLAEQKSPNRPFAIWAKTQPGCLTSCKSWSLFLQKMLDIPRFAHEICLFTRCRWQLKIVFSTAGLASRTLISDFAIAINLIAVAS